MEVSAARLAIAALSEIDVSVADHSELAEVSRAVARVQGFCDLAKVQINRRTRELAELGDRSSIHVLLDEGRLTGRDAQVNDARDRVCEELPAFEDLLASGGCTAGHLDALARHTKNLSEQERADLCDVADDLLASAETDPVGLFDRKARAVIDRIREIHRPGSDVEEFERQRALSNVARWTDRATGMKHTHLQLDPLRDASMWTVIDHHLARLMSEPGNDSRAVSELRVDAVLAAMSTTIGEARVPEVVIHADAGSICHGNHSETLCETVDGQPIPVATMQRLCCEALLQAVIVNPDGTVDQVCAEVRTASRKQRRMLAAMYATCAHPHCQVAFSQCRIHHIVWWTRGGTTVLANLLPLCETHHHLVHEGGWDLTIDDQRQVTWYRPDGTVWCTDHGPNRQPLVRSTAPGRRTEPQQAA